MTKTHQLDFKGGISLRNDSNYLAEGGRYKCGIGILVGKQLTPMVAENKVIVEGRVQYVVLDTGEQ
jgi:hypothetical protein